MIKTSWLETRGTAVLLLAGYLVCGWGTSTAARAAGSDTMTAQEIIDKSRETYASLTSYVDNGSVISEMGGQKNILTFNLRLQRPNLYRCDWAVENKLTPMLAQSGVVWSDGRGNYLATATAAKAKNDSPQNLPNMKGALVAAAGPSWSSSLTVPGLFFHEDFQDAHLALVMSGRSPLTREKDAKAGNIDCYVISSTIDLAKAPEGGKQGTESSMVWIGKKDFLIHQSRSKTVQQTQPAAAPTEQEIDAASRKSLEMQNKPATPQAIAAMRPQMTLIMKQVQSTIKSGFESGLVFTQTHNNIVVNQTQPPAAFAP